MPRKARLDAPGTLHQVIKLLTSNHEAQILNYLKATGFTIGLLVNFMHPKAEIKRFVY